MQARGGSSLMAGTAWVRRLKAWLPADVVPIWARVLSERPAGTDGCPWCICPCWLHSRFLRTGSFTPRNETCQGVEPAVFFVGSFAGLCRGGVRSGGMREAVTNCCASPCGQRSPRLCPLCARVAALCWGAFLLVAFVELGVRSDGDCRIAGCPLCGGIRSCCLTWNERTFSRPSRQNSPSSRMSDCHSQAQSLQFNCWSRGSCSWLTCTWWSQRL